MIPEDARLIPTPGSMLVLREEMPEKIGRIWTSSNWRHVTRSTEAEVVAVSPEILEYEVGDRVLLGSSIGKPVALGLRGQRTLWKVSPLQVLARVSPEVEGGAAATESPHPLDRFDEIVPQDALEDVFEQGDRRGLL